MLCFVSSFIRIFEKNENRYEIGKGGQIQRNGMKDETSRGTNTMAWSE